MSENKHTPGPWRVGHTSSGQYQITPNAMSAVERCANARLIAAAPELLEKLVIITKLYEASLMELDPGYISSVMVDNCRAAIAKATGQEQQS